MSALRAYAPAVVLTLWTVLAIGGVMLTPVMLPLTIGAAGLTVGELKRRYSRGQR